MLVLALPVLAEQLLGVMVGFVDMALAGQIFQTDAHIAAMGSLAYMLWLLNSLFAAVAIGATAVVARLAGAGQQSEAAHASNQSFLLGLVFTIPIALLFGLFGTTMARLLQLEGEAAELAGRYLGIVAWSVPMIAIVRVGIASLRGAGDTISGFVAMGAVNVLNVFGSLALATGWGPFPNLGWNGLEVGTAVGHAAGGLIILGCLIAGRGGLPLRIRGLRPDLEMMRRILRVGIPGGIDSLAILLCHLWYLSIINSLGTASAADGLGIRIESLAYLPGTAFQVAAATMAGQYLGAKDPNRAFRGVWTALLFGGLVMTVAGFLFAYAGGLFTLMFLPTNDSLIAQTTIELLALVAIAMPGLSVTMILTGALRGAGDTRWPLVITFVGYLLVRLPAAYFLAWDAVAIPLTSVTLPALGLGIHGAWVAMVIDTFVRAALVLLRFTHGGWTRVRV